MALVAILIGAVLIVAAIRNSHAALFSALGQDVPAYVIWAAAIVAIGVLGWVPGLSPLSRGLLALVILVLVLNNYQQILSGFQNAWQHPPAAAAPSSSAGTAGASAPGGGSDLFNFLTQNDPMNFLGGHEAEGGF